MGKEGREERAKPNMHEGEQAKLITIAGSQH